MTQNNELTSNWWGEFYFDDNHNKEWQIGPLTLLVQRSGNTWHIAYESINDPDEGDTLYSVTAHGALPASLEENSRFVLPDDDGLLTIRPLLADRPIISRPFTPFSLAAGAAVTLYISSLLWVELSVGTEHKKTLISIPILRPSDTWFGSSTMDGELCYASNTHCRMHLSELLPRPHRAITPVCIHNKADSTLLVERLNLPVPMLHLYQSTVSGQLWTPSVKLVREKAGEIAKLEVNHKAPPEAVESILLNTPRLYPNHNVLFRAFNAVFN
ncbi:MAG: hypothetical protein WCY88_04220 [Spongiibacteraceae bacterium]